LLGLGVEILFSYGAEHDVFGRFLGVDKLKSNGRIPLRLKSFESEGVSCGVAQFLTEHGVIGYEGKLLAVYRVVKLVVTAGSRKNDVRLPFCRLDENYVRRNIAGV